MYIKSDLLTELNNLNILKNQTFYGFKGLLGSPYGGTGRVPS